MTESIIPSFKSMGPASFMRYLTLSIFFHHFLLIMIEAFSFSTALLTMLRVVVCTALTLACVVAVEAIRRSEK
jgi:hypothetical protein